MGVKKYWVGIDLHRNQFTYCVRYSDGKELAGKESMTNLERFARRLGKHSEVAVEATGNTWMFCQVLKKHAGRLVVVNPNQFKVISHSVKKTDKNDAKVLAEFLEKDLLPEVRMKDELQAKIANRITIPTTRANTRRSFPDRNGRRFSRCSPPGARIRAVRSTSGRIILLTGMSGAGTAAAL